MKEIMFPNKPFLEGLQTYTDQLKFLNIFDNRKKLGLRYFLLKWHRRLGKSTLVFNILIRECLQNPGKRYAWIFSQQNVARNIIINEPEMFAQLPKQDRAGDIWKLNKQDLTITFYNGSVLQLFGADLDPDRLRGINFHGCGIDEWSYFTNAEMIWKSIVLPILTKIPESFVIFTYTPQGVTYSSELWNEVSDDERWYSSKITVEDSQIIPEEELEKARRDMGENLFLQEFMCYELADNDLVIIPQASIENLKNFNLFQHGLRRVIGVDPALGGDQCVALYTVNNMITDECIINNTDSVVVQSLLLQFSQKCKCNNLCIDSIGMGKPIADNLRAAGKNIIYFNSSERSNDTRFVNKKAETWFKLKLDIEYGKIPYIDHLEVRRQLSSVRYVYSSRNSRIKCEDKVITKARLGRSPDFADAYVYAYYGSSYVPDEKKEDRLNYYEKQLRGRVQNYNFLSS